jgi:hypothetical protein
VLNQVVLAPTTSQLTAQAVTVSWWTTGQSFGSKPHLTWNSPVASKRE